MAGLIEAANISFAWIEATRYILGQQDYECTNLMVHIGSPTQTIPHVDTLYNNFCSQHDLTELRKTADTVFPNKAYEIVGHNKERLFARRNRIHKVVKGNWGSYFNQMVNWTEQGGNCRNQLNDIINYINNRNAIYRKAYVIHITNPILHLQYTIGGPCLHSVYIQLKPDPRTMSLLAVYRSHDFAVKAYGNYLGLGNLLNFLCEQTNFAVGTVTCVSSTAFIEQEHREGLRTLLEVYDTNG
jgi:thymidylate synthase